MRQPLLYKLPENWTDVHLLWWILADTCPLVKLAVLLFFVIITSMMNFAQTELIKLVAQPTEETRAERADALENRARILAAATALFAEFGVAAVNTVHSLKK